VLADRNAARRRRRMRHLMGVVMKKDFSTLKTVGSDTKWKIDEEELWAIPSSHWALMVLKDSKDRRAGESAKKMAERLRRETILSVAQQRWLRR
jgi:hypothetical protein